MIRLNCQPADNSCVGRVGVGTQTAETLLASWTTPSSRAHRLHCNFLRQRTLQQPTLLRDRLRTGEPAAEQGECPVDNTRSF